MCKSGGDHNPSNYVISHVTRNYLSAIIWKISTLTFQGIYDLGHLEFGSGEIAGLYYLLCDDDRIKDWIGENQRKRRCENNENVEKVH
jgi:hypothetical protein